MAHRHIDAPPPRPPIDLRIGRVEQLFDILDPAPFWDKDLDADAAEFIEMSYREVPPPKPAAIRIRVATAVGADEEDVVQRAITTYFERRREAARLSLREHNRRSRLLLGAALLIMAACFSVRGLLLHWLGESNLPAVLDQGLIILGWVALWRPLEELLFEWHPRWRRVRLYDQLSKLRVSLQPDLKA